MNLDEFRLIKKISGIRFEWRRYSGSIFEFKGIPEKGREENIP